MFFEDPPERTSVWRTDWFAFEENGSGACEKGGVEDVGVADDPADIGGAEDDIARADAEEVSNG